MKHVPLLLIPFFLPLIGCAQSALEIQGGNRSISFEHWYYTTLDSISQRLEFFNYTYAVGYHSDSLSHTTLVNPFLGYTMFKGLGIVTSMTFQNQQFSPFIGIQYTKSLNAHNLYSVVSYSPSNSGMIELFLWYLYQPIKKGWRPFVQFNAVSNRGIIHHYSQLKIRMGPSYKCHALGLAWDVDWDGQWNATTNYGIFYRFQLQ